ncbi:cytochrome C [Candidatus Megaera polyxenophila]|jgi:DNA ligase (NAD+)|uniref:virulence protein RhuM/Fic/DOC family protein n=1 Tax=Candidatus Megaera polyxenophila TaxID=988779 RepID=UPI00249DEACD|nr:type II toxin-antitoxin system death-on-curing family toxin [Candidatus Megaera polyxenophila]BBB56271.1 cytochrome C [Candidatus Megaera polyxenophila]
MFNSDQIIIYEDKNGQISVDVVLRDEMVWLNLTQLSELFVRDKSVISRHIKNILKEQELSEVSTVAKFATVQAEGDKSVTRQLEYYNLDMIISVGYRVNSRKAVEFRKWASNILKDYLIKGYSVNYKKIMRKELEELKQTVLLLSNTLLNQNLVNETGSELLNLIRTYTKTWDILLKYDENRLELPKSGKSGISRELKYKEAKLAIINLKTELLQKSEASNLFGQERGKALDGIIGSLYQTFGGDDLYPSIEEKAAHLIYFIIKDHPFNDGNKRIGCLLFLLFLSINEFKLTSVSPESLTALALLIAESDPKHKKVIIRLVINLLNEKN